MSPSTIRKLFYSHVSVNNQHWMQRTHAIVEFLNDRNSCKFSMTHNLP